MGGYFNNIGATLQRGECKLSKDKKILQVWDGIEWKIYEPIRSTSVDGLMVCNPPCNDVVNKKHYLYDTIGEAWIMCAGLYGSGYGVIYAPYVLMDEVPTVGNIPPKHLIKSRYASKTPTDGVGYMTWDISTT